jgi:hypothetical protein
LLTPLLVLRGSTLNLHLRRPPLRFYGAPAIVVVVALLHRR